MLLYVIKGVKFNINASIVLIPGLIILMALLGLGFGIIISSVTTKYRDLIYLVTFGVQLWMYATPVVYPLSIIPEKLRIWILLNPLTPVIETFRNILLGSGMVNISHLLYSTGFALITITIGVLMFNKVEKTFIDTV